MHLPDVYRRRCRTAPRTNAAASRISLLRSTPEPTRAGRESAGTIAGLADRYVDGQCVGSASPERHGAVTDRDGGRVVDVDTRAGPSPASVALHSSPRGRRPPPDQEPRRPTSGPHRVPGAVSPGWRGPGCP